MTNTKKNVCIIGSGITGLACGYTLNHCNNIDFVIYEKTNKIGGMAEEYEIEKNMVINTAVQQLLKFDDKNPGLIDQTIKKLNYQKNMGVNKISTSANHYDSHKNKYVKKDIAKIYPFQYKMYSLIMYFLVQLYRLLSKFYVGFIMMTIPFNVVLFFFSKSFIDDYVIPTYIPFYTNFDANTIYYSSLGLNVTLNSLGYKTSFNNNSVSETESIYFKKGILDFHDTIAKKFEHKIKLNHEVEYVCKDKKSNKVLVKLKNQDKTLEYDDVVMTCSFEQSHKIIKHKSFLQDLTLKSKINRYSDVKTAVIKNDDFIYDDSIYKILIKKNQAMFKMVSVYNHSVDNNNKYCVLWNYDKFDENRYDFKKILKYRHIKMDLFNFITSFLLMFSNGCNNIWFCGNNVASNDHESSFKTGTIIAEKLSGKFIFVKYGDQYENYKMIKLLMGIIYT